MKLKFFVAIWLFVLLSNLAHSKPNEQPATCDTAPAPNFIINDIFDLSDEDMIFIHHWANFFHIKTKKITLLNESAFFLKKCKVDQADLLELERHLRQRRFIRDARVSAEDDGNVNVETWDNWSLTPTIDFGRKGGVNKYAIGIKDRNLLGLGIDTDIEYFSDDQRSGYKLKTEFPLFLNQNITANIYLSNNDDGNAKAAFIHKNFVSFDTPYAYSIGFDTFIQTDTAFQNGLDIAKFKHEKAMFSAHYQWLVKDTPSETIRYGFGFSHEEHEFSELESNVNFVSGFIPQNRKQNYPFASFEYVQKDFRKFTNFNLIAQIEDFNLGWHFSALVGRDFTSSDYAPDLLWRSKISKGLKTSNMGHLFFDASFDGELHSSSIVQDRYQFKFSAEYFHKINDNWGAYFKNANIFSNNPFLDEPITLGSDEGVRGYPLQYQHGTRSTQFTAEARYYPHISIYKFFELGGAAFIDAGKASGDTPVNNVSTSMLSAVGIGARFFSAHSSDAQVIHVDIIKPLSNDANVDSFEFRVSTKHSF